MMARVIRRRLPMSDKSISLGLTVALIAAGMLLASAAAHSEEQLIAVIAPAQQSAIIPVFTTQQAPDAIQRGTYQQPTYASIDEADDPDLDTPADPRLKRQVVDYTGNEPAGTIVVDTPNTYLYYVLGNGKAIRYGIGVGREGFTWNGTQTVARKTEWPDWHPPAEMIARQPYLPRFMAGGPGNPLGARAMYLGNSLYRIHGTNAPDTIGQRVSSGCIRLTNEDVTDLFNRVTVGAKVVVLPDTGRRT